MNKDTSFLTLSTIETPSADVRAPRRFTPLIQAYCVNALKARVSMCLGRVGVRYERMIDVD